MGCNVCLPNSHVEALDLLLQNVTVFGDRPCKELIKLVGPNPV